MNKFTTLAASALVLSMALSAPAEARDGFYLAARGGLVWNNFNSKDDAVSETSQSNIGRANEYSGAIGYRYKFVRAEIEYIHRDDTDEPYDDENGVHTADLSVGSKSLMFNGYLDFLPNYWISPYIGGGLGVSKIEFTHTEVGALGGSDTWKKNRAFTWQAGAGVSIRLNKCLNIDTGYRYWTLGKILHAEVNAHEWYAGLRFTF